jgi:hypothetical protein
VAVRRLQEYNLSKNMLLAVKYEGIDLTLSLHRFVNIGHEHYSTSAVGRIGVLAVPQIRNRLYAEISNYWVNLWTGCSCLPC